MKLLLLVLFLIILPASGLHWHQDTIVVDHYTDSQSETWTLNDSANAAQIAHFCHMHQPISREETVIVRAGSQIFTLVGSH